MQLIAKMVVPGSTLATSPTVTEPIDFEKAFVDLAVRVRAFGIELVVALQGT